MRVVVRTVAPIDEALYERTAGQVSDLPAELRQQRDATLESTMAARLERARALAAHFDATAVVWFEHPPAAGPVVVVALPSRERVLVRTIGGDGEVTSSTSAMLEASSLVVRTALLALESGATVGIPSDELIRTEPVLRDRSTPPAQRSSMEPPRAHPRWAPFVSAGWQVAVDGRSRMGAHAATLEAGTYLGLWSGSLRGTLGLPSRSLDGHVSLDVSRHTGGVFLGRTLGQASAWKLDAMGGPALIVFRRSASPRSALFSPSPPSTHTSLAGALELRALWAPSRTLPLRIGLTIGADALARPPSFSYETPTGIVERPSWFVTPRGGLFLSLDGSSVDDGRDMSAGTHTAVDVAPLRDCRTQTCRNFPVSSGGRTHALGSTPSAAKPTR